MSVDRHRILPCRSRAEPRAGFLVLLLISVSAGLCTGAKAQDLRKSDKGGSSGLAIGSALGADNAMFGGHALYYVQLPSPRFRIAPHFGVGVTLPEWGAQKRRIGAAGGIMGSFGRRHRLVVDVFTAPVRTWSLELHHAVVDRHLVYGVGLAVGWEWMTRRGFYMRANIGPAYAIGRRTSLGGRYLDWTVTGNLLAIGYKLW